MNQVVEIITNNISSSLSNINLLKSFFLETNSVDDYNACNDLRVSFKIFYKEILEQISDLNNNQNDEGRNLLLVVDKYKQIKLDSCRFSINKNKVLVENIINSITHIKDLTELLIKQQKETPLNKEEVLIIKNQIMCFKCDIFY